MLTSSSPTRTSLLAYVEVDDGYYALYEAYQPQIAILRRISRLLTNGHVIIPSRYSCKDCIRNIPQMARISEYLPGWTWDIYNHDEKLERSQVLKIEAIPTFIIYSQPGGAELGRIVENPQSGSLEQDMLAIIEAKWSR